MGRPSDYTQELADDICSQLADGLSMRKVCEPDEMPNKATVFRWLREYAAFSDQYARAKEEAADHLAEEMLEIADDKGEEANSRRVRVDTRKWLASKLKPKRYGDKVTHEGGDKPIDVNHTWEVLPVASGRSKPAD